jgi:hypothetical protein
MGKISKIVGPEENKMMLANRTLGTGQEELRPIMCAQQLFYHVSWVHGKKEQNKENLASEKIWK